MTTRAPTPTPPLKRRGLSANETSQRTNSPPLQGRGKGWGLSAGRMAEIAHYAREMRRNPTEPEVRLWRHLSRSQLGGYKFRRQSEIGPFIPDFLCPQKALIVEVDGETHDVDKDRGRDLALERLGFAVLHVTNPDVMRNIEGVLQAILIALEQAPDRWENPHPNPSPEAEGLKEVEAQKLLGISLEGSVG